MCVLRPRFKELIVAAALYYLNNSVPEKKSIYSKMRPKVDK